MDLEGRWRIVGATVPDGTPGYTGVLDISPRGETYRLEWDVTAGRYVGIGLLEDDHLLVACGRAWEGLRVASVRALADGALRVRWSEGGDVAEEVAERDGLALALTRDGDVYEATWRPGGAEEDIGIGFDVPGGVVAGWSAALAELAVLDYVLDPADHDRLSARWALGGSTSLATESLERGR
jgi:hypothetical protein